MNAAIQTVQALESDLFDRFGSQLNDQRFLLLTGDALSGILAVAPGEMATFADHWPRLTRDNHMGDGGTYRFRRYGEFEAHPQSRRRQLPHGPYQQPQYINKLNGGISRLFDPLEPSFVSDPVLNRLLDWLTHIYDQCERSPQHWNIRLHPYRIVANPGQSGHPTPEGLHRDGVDYIVSMLVSRHNVEGGESIITNNQGLVLEQRTLVRPMDIMIGQDTTTMHAVTPVTPIKSDEPAWRDVLVVAFTKIQT
jgi:hypothetical protein